MDLAGLHFKEVAPVADADFFTEEIALGVDGRIGLSNQVLFLLIAGEVVDLVGNPALFHLAVRSFDEPEIIDPGIGGHGADEADVGTFRRLNRADAPVVGRMNVTDLKPSTVSGETAWPKGGQTAFVGQFGQRIGLVHELAQLGASEEVPDHSAERFRVDELLRSHALDVHVEHRHAFLHQTLGAGQADTALVGQKLAHGADAAGTEVIDVVQQVIGMLGVTACGSLAITPPERDEVLHCSDEIFLGEDPLVRRKVDAHPLEFLVDLMATHAAEVVLFRVEKQTFEQAARVRDGWRIARTEAAVDFLESLVFGLGRIFAERLDDGVVVLGVNHLDLFDANAAQRVHHGLAEGFERLGSEFFAVHDVGSEDLGGNLGLVHRGGEL